MKALINRRALGGIIAGGAASGVAAGALGASPGGAAPLDVEDPAKKLEAFMKIYTSLETARVWYWYTGTIDAALGDGPVRPFIGVSTLIRRDVSPTRDGRFEMEMFEGSYFHAVGDAQPLNAMHNAMNGRDVQPFHYREGPYHVGYDVLGPYNPATGVHYSHEVKDSPIHQAGDQIWFSRDNYIDAPNAFTVDKWPLESYGPRDTVGSFATHFARLSDVANPAVRTAPCAFRYEAFMRWWPWMLMGQTAGRMVWRGDGLKLPSIDHLPASARAGFMAVHPRLFLERPWNDFANLPIDYQRERKPASI